MGKGQGSASLAPFSWPPFCLKNKVVKKAIALFPLCCLLVWQACSDEKTCAAPLNPNGDSELALLMRQMFDDGMRVKQQIEQGEKVSIAVDFEKIRSAKATDPEKMQPAEFQDLAVAYVEAMHALKATGPEEAEARYAAVVSSCMNCHHRICPGPMVRIKKMVL